MSGNGLFVDYCAKDFLDGTQLLGPWEELAYRRICDMIYATNDKLANDDDRLGWVTKTGKKWKSIKATLVNLGKIFITEDNRISNKRCQQTLVKSARKMAQKVAAGKASAASGKSLKNLNSHRTDVQTDVRTSVRTNYILKELNTQERGDIPPIPPLPPKRRIDSDADPDFREWYAGYPRKVSRGSAARAYAKARKSASLEDLIAGRDRYAVEVAGRDKELIKHPATWLNGKCWLDETIGETNGKAHQTPTEYHLDVAKRAVERIASRRRAYREAVDDTGADDAALLPTF